MAQLVGAKFGSSVTIPRGAIRDVSQIIEDSTPGAGISCAHAGEQFNWRAPNSPWTVA